MAFSPTAPGAAQVMDSSDWLRNFSIVRRTRKGFSGWPGEEYAAQRSSVMIFTDRIESRMKPTCHAEVRKRGGCGFFALWLWLFQAAQLQWRRIGVMKTISTFSVALSGFVFSSLQSTAWDYEGHRAVNQLALAALPANFPAFVKTPQAQERIAFLSGEPDRWRNMSDELPLAHFNGPDHFIDLDDLQDCGLTPQTLPIFRYDFTAKLALERAAHPERFPPVDPLKNKDHTRELIGFAPWAITEYCGKLKSAFSYLKAFQNYGGTPEEIANAQQNIIYIMGVMGHYVGDCAQPLHVTKHFNGWVGDNPHGYTTNKGFHAWIDGGYFRKIGGIKLEPLAGKMRPVKIVGDPLRPEDLFRQVIAYLLETQKQVEPLYQLQKQGKLYADDDKGPEGKIFLEGQLVKGGQMLGDLWYSAWQQATEDKYLIGQLKLRNAPAAKKAE
jgi:hypothetical protein